MTKLQSGDFLEIALQQARQSETEGGVAVGAVLVKNREVIASSHDRTRQLNDPIATAEMDCIRQAGRRNDQAELVLYTTRYPDRLVVGTMLQFAIGGLVIALPEISNHAISLLKTKNIPITFSPMQQSMALATQTANQPKQKPKQKPEQKPKQEPEQSFLAQAYLQAVAGYEEGGVPVGAVLVQDGKVIASGRNKRAQEGDPIIHGETDCLRNAGIMTDYRGIDLYTTLSPCMMCAAAIVHFGIKRVVVGEDQNFPGNIAFLKDNGVEVVLIDDEKCKALMAKFIEQCPELWFEDIAGNEQV